jgi:hypothetical protein
VFSVRCLGVLVSHDLRWNDHAKDIALACRRKLGALNRVFGLAPTEVRRRIYLSSILPKIDYCCALYDSSFSLTVLDSVNKLASRVISRNFDYRSSSSLLVSQLSLPNLTLRRKYFRLLQFFKIYHRLSPVSLFYTIHRPHYSSLRLHHSKYVRIPSSVDGYSPQTVHSSFFYSTIADWNNLPESVICLSSLASFKTALCQYLFQ